MTTPCRSSAWPTLARVIGMLWLAMLPLAPAAQAATIADPHILVLEDESAERPAFISFMQGLREGLAPLGAAVVFTENLDLARFPAPAYLERQSDWLSRKYGDVRVDIVVAGGPRALDFALRARGALFPAVPILFIGDEPADPAHGNVSGVAVGLYTADALRDAIALLPATRQVVLVSDSIDDLNYWRRLREDLKALPQDMQLVVLEGLPIDELKQRVAALPAQSLVFYVRQVRDRHGRTYAQTEILDALATATTAPLFGQLAWQMGRGIVGGRLVDPQEIGRKIARLVQRVARGEEASSIPVERRAVYPAVFDARQLERWRIDRSRLPPASTVLFEPVSLWQERRALVIGVIAALLLQSMLIGALLWERRRRRRAEVELRQRTQQVARLNRSAALGEVSAAIAHEVNQPLGAILLNAEAADRLLGADRTAVDEAREILGDIRRDGRRAGAVVEKVRQLFRRSVIDARRISLNRLARDVLAMLEHDHRFDGIALELDLCAGLPPLTGDPVQLQQVVVNLVTNAAEALRDAPPGARRIVLRTRLPQAPQRSQVELAVLDSGPGLEPGDLDKVFEPFFSSKTEGMGIGLAIGRGVAAAHGGSLTVENRPEGGACFRLVLPALPA